MSASSPFLLTVDLETLRVRGSHTLHAARGCSVAFAGHLARTQTESPEATPCERLLDAYRRHGPMLSLHLLGQYAAVLIDAVERRVLLVQDSFGLRPLFFKLNGNDLVVATDLETLLAWQPTPDLNEAYFAELLANGAPPLRLTPFSGVERLGLGTTLVIEPTGRTALQPWLPSGKQEQFEPEEANLRLRALLDEAVSSMLPAQGRVLCELSGGLDSTTVFVTAHKLCPRIEALTLFSSQGEAGDDFPFAETVANGAGVRWHRIDMDLYPTFSSLPSHPFGEPGNEMRIALQTAYREVLERERSDVILTGSAGDVVFGYGGIPPHHLADGLASGRVLAAVASARSWCAAAGGQRPWTHFFGHFTVNSAWRHLRRQSLRTKVGERPPRWLARDFVRGHGITGSMGPQQAPRVREPGTQYLWECIYRMAALDANSAFQLHLTADTRHPLFHRPLVEFMLSLDPSLRSWGSDDRILQRRALTDRLPEIVRTRKTKGSDQQLREREQMKNETWRHMLTNDSRLVARGWVDAQLWRAQVERARFGVFNGLGCFDAAIMTECWLRTIESHSFGPAPQLG